MNTATFGPAYDKKIDGRRINRQMDVIKKYMLSMSSFNKWLTLRQIEADLLYPQASISAQLRHLRKQRFGGYILEKRRRNNAGTWEYRLLEPTEENAQMSLGI